MSDRTDTIFAVASGAGRSAVTVLRLSGPASGDVIDRLGGPRPAPRQARLRRLRAADGEVLDQALVLWLPGPGSYTGEDSAELHLHGGAAVLAGVAEALVAAGIRPAEPGEFSRRAFLNGRMDLLEAEAVADLVDAETAAQRRQALRQLDGALGTLYRDWAARLARLMARQEALIDFPDEDLPADVEAADRAELAALQSVVAAHLADDRRGERLRDGVTIAVTGQPNVGKSSLVNALTGRDVAIVAAAAGTTRDVLEARMVIAGVPVVLVDTAGVRETADPVEAEGVRRALARAASADLVLAVRDPREAQVVDADARVLRIVNKIDLAPAVRDGEVGVSVWTGAGMAALRRRLEDEVRRLTMQAGPPALTRARHRAALNEALARLGSARGAALAELRAEDLRLALRAVGRITGQVGVEDLLGLIFEQFCIGK